MATTGTIKNAGSMGLPAGYNTKAGQAALTATQKQTVAKATAPTASVGSTSFSNPVSPNLNTPQSPAASTTSPSVNKGNGSTSSNFNFPDIFGDVNKKPTVGQQTEGLWTSQKNQFTDLTKIDTSKVDPNSYKYGKDAVAQEAAKGGYLAPRNDVLAAYYLKSGKTDQQSIYNELVKNENFLTTTEEDRQNTARAISERIGKFQGQQQQAQNPLDAEFSTIEKDYANKKDQLLKAGAIEDRYTNFNEVDKEVNDVLKAGGEDRAAKGYNGMPSDADIQDIATKTGVTFDRAKRVLEGFGYETLNMQEEFKKESQRGYNRSVDDMTTQQQRDQEDMDRSLAETKQKIQWQQADVLKQTERNIAAASMVGALRGQTMTSGFTQGIKQVQADTDETIGRLETNLSQATSLTAEMKGRSLEDYNKNMGRAKEELDYSMRDLNQQMGTAYNTILQSYGGDALLAKLKELNSQMLDAKIESVSKYVDVISKINKDKRDEVDQLMKLNEYSTKNQEATRTNLTQNKNSALSSFSVNDLQGMVKSGSLSMDQYKMALATMTTDAKNALLAQGNPTEDDFDNLGKFIDAGLSMQEAVVKTIAESNGRLEPIGNYKGTTSSTGKKYSATDPQRSRVIRNNNPVAFTTDVAKTMGLVEGSDYEKGDSFVGSGGKVYYTAKLKGTPEDSIETTIKGLDNMAKSDKLQAFYSQGGQQRRSHTSMSDKQRQSLSNEEKRQVVEDMYQHEESRYSIDTFLSEGGKGGTADKTTLFEAIGDGYAKSSEIDKYLKENKTNKATFIGDYIKEKAPDGDATSIADAWGMLKEAGIKDDPATLLTAIKKSYGPDKGAEFVINSYATKDFSDAKVLTAFVNGMKFVYGTKLPDEDSFKTMLDKNGIGFRERRKIWNALEG